MTVGMIDPVRSTWGRGERALAGRRVVAPRLDVDALCATAPRVGVWVQARLRPKVLVATQTRIVEAVADPVGDCVPVTPTISVEPHDPGIDVWMLTAALSAPPVAARAVAVHFGAGLSSAALRWSARAVLDVALPSDRRSWERGASICRRLHEAPATDVPGLLGELGASMCAAHGMDEDHPVLRWWTERVQPV